VFGTLCEFFGFQQMRIDAGTDVHRQDVPGNVAGMA